MSLGLCINRVIVTKGYLSRGLDDHTRDPNPPMAGRMRDEHRERE